METMRDKMSSLHVYGKLRKIGFSNKTALRVAELWERIAYRMVYLNADMLYRKALPIKVSSRQRNF